MHAVHVVNLPVAFEGVEEGFAVLAEDSHVRSFARRHRHNLKQILLSLKIVDLLYMLVLMRLHTINSICLQVLIHEIELVLAQYDKHRRLVLFDQANELRLVLHNAAKCNDHGVTQSLRHYNLLLAD